MGLVLVAGAALIWWCVARCCGVCRVAPAAPEPPRREELAGPRAAGAAQWQEAAVAGAAAGQDGAAAGQDPAVERAPVAAVARAAAAPQGAQAPATPAPKAPPQQQMPPVPKMGPHRRNKRATPEVGWRELHQCARTGHSLLAGRNQCSVYITCQVCRKHASWRKGDIPTFQHSQPLNERLRHYWGELNEHVVQG